MSVAVASKGVVSGKGKTVLGWISYGSGAIGGSALAATFVGTIFGWFGSLGAWAQGAATISMVLLFAAMVIDLLIDGTPNRLAIWAVILLPSLAQAVGGAFAAGLRQAGDRLTAEITARTAGWFGQSSVFVIAVLGIAISLLVARRVVKKGGA